MWIPETEEDIRTVVDSRRLEETESFEAKQELSSTNDEIAKDIAAMTVDGGVIIYGIGEDANKRLTKLTPVPLDTAPNRINQIVTTGIKEPPFVEIKAIESERDPSVGYIVVVVPPSPRAPHMVTLRGENCYYGRGSNGNRKLNEGDVSRLYERRQRLEEDLETRLTTEVQNSPVDPDERYAYLHMYVRPVMPNDTMLEKACKDASLPVGLNRLFEDLDSIYRISSRYYLTPPPMWNLQDDGYRGIVEPRNSNTGEPEILTLQLDFNGMGHVFCARVAEKTPHGFVFSSDIVASTTSRLLSVMGRLYKAANYVGMVDIGVAITNLKGAVPSGDENLHFYLALVNKPYSKSDYRKTARRSAAEVLQDPKKVASDLVIALIRAINQNPTVNPFENVKS